MTGGNGFTVVEWKAWEGFLIRRVLPTARRVGARPGLAIDVLEDTGGPTLLHINLTRPRSAFPYFDAWLADNEERGIVVLNGRLDSIDKWAVHDACASADLPMTRARIEGDPDSKLVVKMRANHLGKHDRSLPPSLLGAPSPPSWPYPERIRIMRRSEVGRDIWEDPRLAIEQFITNQAQRFHRAYVVGRYVCAATACVEGLQKELNHENGEAFRSVDDGLALPIDNRDPLSVAYRVARAMNADYAAIDLVEDDAGLIYAIDLNATPWWGNDTNDRLIDEIRAAFIVLAGC